MNELTKLDKCLHQLNSVEKHLHKDVAENEAVKCCADLLATMSNWAQCIDSIHQNRDDLRQCTQTTVTQPVNQFKAAFSQFEDSIRQYKQLMDSAGRFTTKVAKYKNLERTSNNILKLKDYQQKLQQTEQDLSRMKRILECELSKFIQHRGEHLQPSITGWVSANMLYVGNNLNSFTEDEHATGMAKHQRDDLQQEMFDLIDGLCIVNSSH